MPKRLARGVRGTQQQARRAAIAVVDSGGADASVRLDANVRRLGRQ